MPSGKLGWLQFYPRDWYSDPQLAACHAVTRGIWMDLLSLMFIQGSPQIITNVTTLTRLGRCDLSSAQQFLTDLGNHKFADVTECNGVYTIVSRRLERDLNALESLRKKNRDKVRRHRSKASVTAGNQNVTGYTPYAVTKSSESEYVSVSESVSKSSSRKSSVERMWPDDLALTEPMRKYATGRGINPDTEFGAWHDDCLAHGRKYRDWEAAWRTRINNAPKFAPKNGTPAVVELPKRKENYSDRIDRW